MAGFPCATCGGAVGADCPRCPIAISVDDGQTFDLGNQNLDTTEFIIPPNVDCVAGLDPTNAATTHPTLVTGENFVMTEYFKRNEGGVLPGGAPSVVDGSAFISDPIGEGGNRIMTASWTQDVAGLVKMSGVIEDNWASQLDGLLATGTVYTGVSGLVTCSLYTSALIDGAVASSMPNSSGAFAGNVAGRSRVGGWDINDYNVIFERLNVINYYVWLPAGSHTVDVYVGGYWTTVDPGDPQFDISISGNTKLIVVYPGISRCG